MAREIHDTIAQNLAAISVQLRLAAKKYLNGDSATVTGHLDAAQQLVRDSLEITQCHLEHARACPRKRRPARRAKRNSQSTSPAA